jgi:hypothetical protein
MPRLKRRTLEGAGYVLKDIREVRGTLPGSQPLVQSSYLLKPLLKRKLAHHRPSAQLREVARGGGIVFPLPIEGPGYGSRPFGWKC